MTFFLLCSLSSKALTVPEQARQVEYWHNLMEKDIVDDLILISVAFSLQAERFLFLELHHLIPLFLGTCKLNTQVSKEILENIWGKGPWKWLVRCPGGT